MKTSTISIAEDFSPFPAGRYEKDGSFTGEGFRKKMLLPALKNNDTVIVQFDNPLGYGSSFLEEAFGGLIREEGFTEKILSEKLILQGKSESIKLSILSHIHKAQKTLNSKE